MKAITWVNIGSIIFFLLSGGAWIVLTNDYFKMDNQQPVVMGARVVTSEQKVVQPTAKTMSQNNHSILNEVIQVDIDEKSFVEMVAQPPQKKEDVGVTYVRAKAAVAIDVDSEKILHDQNANQKLPIASLTKLMTALVVVDEIDKPKSEIITIDRETCNTPTSIIGCPTSTYCFSDTLKIGETVRAQDLLEAMLSNSANDAAVALGNHIAGSQEKFAKLMNKKAKEIGLKNTHFCNPSGLDEDSDSKQCYSSAKDIALLVVYALKNKKYQKIWPIFKIKERWFYSVDGKMKHRYASTNILLDTMSNCEGAKTGFTYEAGKTLMMVASHPKQKDKKVVAVLLNDAYRFEDVQKMFNWVFKNYNWKK